MSLLFAGLDLTQVSLGRWTPITPYFLSVCLCERESNYCIVCIRPRDLSFLPFFQYDIYTVFLLN